MNDSNQATSPVEFVADYLRKNLPDVSAHLARRPECEDDYRTLVRVGGVAIGAVVANEVLENGRIIYEVEPFPAWSGLPPHPRQEVQP